MEQKIFGQFKIKALVLTSFLTIFVWVLIMSNISFGNLKHIGDESYKLHDGIDSLEKYSTLDSLAQFIRYYDEVLTQSARNYAFTSDKKWKDQYYQFIPILDSKIKQAIQKGDNLEKDFFFKVNDANIALVELEEKSILLVDKGDSKSAILILESEEYWDLKKKYQDPLIDYVNKRGKSYEEVLNSNVIDIKTSSEYIQVLMKNQSRNFIILISILILLLIFIVYYFDKKLTNPIISLVKLIDSISSGDYKVYNINSKKQDIYEISQLKESLGRIIKTMKLAVLESQGSSDISYHEALEVSKKNEKRFRILAETVPAILYSCKASGNFDALYVSKSVEDLGYTQAEFIKTPNFWIDHIHPNDRKKVDTALHKLILTGSANYQYRFLRRDGTYKTLQDYSKVLKDQEGNPIEIVGMMYEIEDNGLNSNNPNKLNVKNKRKPIVIPKGKPNLDSK